MIPLATLKFRHVAGVLCIVGCAGGGGSSQSAPEQVKAGEPIVVELFLNVWGSGGDIENRYTDILLSYRRVGGGDYNSVGPKLISRTSDREHYQFVIPPLPDGATGEIEYHIDVKLDGHASRLPGVRRITVI